MPTEATQQDQPRAAGAESKVEVSPHDQFMQRLRAEAGESDDDQPPAADEQDTEEDLDAPTDDADDDDDEGPPALEEGQVLIDGQVFDVDTVRNALKEDAAGRMRDADYRRKTQVAARRAREAEALGQEAIAVVSVFDNLADQNLQQFQNLDWGRLKMDHPEQYDALRKQHDMAANGSQQLKRAVQETRQKVAAARKTMLDQEAEASVEILAGTIPQWTPKLYGELREYAVATGRYSAEEFNEISDWRAVEGLHALYERDAAASKLKEMRNSPQKNRQVINKPAGTRPAVQPRNAPLDRDQGGKFATAEKRLRENPGDRSAAVSFFERKLKQEGKLGG